TAMRFARFAIRRCCNAQTEWMGSLPSISPNKIAERPDDLMQYISEVVGSPNGKRFGTDIGERIHPRCRGSPTRSCPKISNLWSQPMRFWLRPLIGAIVVVGIAIAGLSYAYWDTTVLIGSTAINYMRYWSAPVGTLETEVAQTGTAAQLASTASALPQAAPSGTAGDWPSYNKTLTSNRFSELSQINRTNAEKLKILCTYDSGQYTGFNSGLLEVDGALIFVTAF